MFNEKKVLLVHMQISL